MEETKQYAESGDTKPTVDELMDMFEGDIREVEALGFPQITDALLTIREILKHLIPKVD